jgi:hypothetical protein
MAMNTAVVWNVTPYHLIDLYQISETPFGFIFSRKMKLARLSETSVLYHTVLHNVSFQKKKSVIFNRLLQRTPTGYACGKKSYRKNVKNVLGLLSDEANEDNLMPLYGLKTNPYHTATR